MSVYESVRNARKTQQKDKRRQLVALLKELSQEIGTVGQEARGNSMQVFDPEELGDAAAGGLDSEKAQERAEKARLLQEEREARERAAEQAQKEKLDQECSQRDKEGMASVRNALASKVQKAQKELGRGVDSAARRDGEEGPAPSGDSLAYAVYDQDVRSRQNQMVKKIDESE